MKTQSPPKLHPAAANDNGGVLGDYLTPNELADILGKSVKTLQRWHAARRGPARVKIGNAIYYRQQAVRDWLAANENTPTKIRRR